MTLHKKRARFIFFPDWLKTAFSKDKILSGLPLFVLFILINVYFRSVFIFPQRPQYLFHWRVPFLGIMNDSVAAGLFYLFLSLIFLLIPYRKIKIGILSITIFVWSGINFANYEFSLTHNQLLPLSWFDELKTYKNDAGNLDVIFTSFFNVPFAAHIIVPLLMMVAMIYLFPRITDRANISGFLLILFLGSGANGIVNDPGIQPEPHSPQENQMLRFWYIRADYKTVKPEDIQLNEISPAVKKIVFETPSEKFRLPQVQVEKPNLVYIQLESFRAFEVGVFGSRLGATPNFDRYARQGILFKNIFSLEPLTRSGQVGALCGGYNAVGGSAMTVYTEHKIKCISDYLAESGYDSWWFHGQSGVYDYQSYFLSRHGVKHLMERLTFPITAEKLGWGISDEELIKHTFAHMDQMQEPFFLYLQTQTNHAPFQSPPEFHKNYGLPEITEKYISTIAYTDAMLGRFLDTYLATDKGKRSLIVIYADHGLDKPLSGNPPQPEPPLLSSFRVPLLIIYPEKERTGSPQIFEDVGSIADIYPTVLDLLNISSEHPILSKSLLRDYKYRFAPATTPSVWLFNDERMYFQDGRVFDKNGNEVPDASADKEWNTVMNDLPFIQAWMFLQKDTETISQKFYDLTH